MHARESKLIYLMHKDVFPLFLISPSLSLTSSSLNRFMIQSAWQGILGLLLVFTETMLNLWAYGQREKSSKQTKSCLSGKGASLLQELDLCPPYSIAFPQFLQVFCFLACMKVQWGQDLGLQQDGRAGLQYPVDWLSVKIIIMIINLP